MLDELYNSHEFNIDIFSYSNSMTLGTCYGAFTANNLKPYDYFEYLLTELPEHQDDTDRSFLEKLLPWAPELPEHIRKTKRS